MTSIRLHFKENTQVTQVHNLSFEACFGVEEDYRRQMHYSTSFTVQCSKRVQREHQKFHKKNIDTCNHQYVRCQGLGPTQLYLQNDRLTVW